MATYTTSGTADGTVDFMNDLHTFLTTTAGWTSHDNQLSAGTPYFVVKSTGTSGIEDIYIQYIKGTNCVIAVPCLSWNNESHLPYERVASSSTHSVDTRDASTPAFAYWVFANPDRIVIFTKLIDSYFGNYAGLIKRYWSSDMATLPVGSDGGSNAVISVDDASIFTANKYYNIRSNTRVDRVLVSAVDTVNNTITASIEATAWLANITKIGEDTSPICTSNHYLTGPRFLTRVSGVMGIGTNISNGGYDGSAFTLDSSILNATDPDGRFGLVSIFPIFLTSNLHEELRGEYIDLYRIGDFAAGSEDELVIGTTTYKVFKISGAYNFAVKSSS